MTTAHLILALALLLSNLPLQAADPDCTGRDRWPAMSAFVQLKNSGVTDNDKLDQAKTEVWRLASEKIGEDLFRQVHHISFSELSGATIEVITVSDASSEECSMSGVRVFRLAPSSAR